MLSDPHIRPVRGRFAPSPTGRMHLGNIFTAVLSWVSAKAQGGSWILRIEDLDPQRSKRHWAELIEDDLRWLGLVCDEGGLNNTGPHGPYSQSLRTPLYEDALERLTATGLTYPCTCTRADLHSVGAPHASDGRIIYSGRCRPASLPCHDPWHCDTPHAVRLYVPDRDITFDDMVFGGNSFNPARECGDFVLRRADGAWAYQLAVVVDDAMMGVTEVMRGSDLLSSAAWQIYLYELLGYEPPRWTHVPLLCNSEGRRLSKRDNGLNMEALRKRYTPGRILAAVGRLARLLPDEVKEATPDDLIKAWNIDRLPASETFIVSEDMI